MPENNVTRGFPESEFENRTHTLQIAMAENKVDAILLTSEPNVRYFSGFFSQFWQSPTRPWFLVIPAEGKPIAVIPEVGVSGMAETWVDDIRSWPSPRPEDDGISLLVVLFESLSRQFGRIGMTLGPESTIRMPINNFARLKSDLGKFEFIDISELIHNQRMFKSELEIAKTKRICDIASATFSVLPEMASIGMSEIEIVSKMKIDLLERGADTVPYVVVGSGKGGYESIIMGPTERTLSEGDILIIDTGSTFDGYFCDFDRNWGLGDVDDAAKSAYEIVWQATEAGYLAAHPGATTSDLWQAMNDVMVAGGSMGNEVGRLGHGLGIELTERPSNTQSDQTPLQPGMIITLEPGMIYAAGKQMVHEENIVITEDGAEWLTRRADPELPIIE